MENRTYMIFENLVNNDEVALWVRPSGILSPSQRRKVKKCGWVTVPPPVGVGVQNRYEIDDQNIYGPQLIIYTRA